jgi:hypothetical protein
LARLCDGADETPDDRALVMQRAAAAVAALFGLATIVAGGSVLTGRSDPGYVVFRPLLIYNTAMGVAYLAAGIAIWRSLNRGMYAAAAIFLLNLIASGAILYLYTAGGAVAIDSLRAMTLRTAVWLGIFLGLAWVSRRSGRHGDPVDNT